MDDAATVYKLLTVIRRIEQAEEPDMACLTPEALSATQENLDILMRKLIDSGFVKGMRLIEPANRPAIILWGESRPTITRSGMEYLVTSPMMQEARRRLKHG